jgi:antitoxin VapB
MARSTDQQKSDSSLAESSSVSRGVHEVEVIERGHRRLVTPIDQRWDEFLVNGSRPSDDFMSEREQPRLEQREPLCCSETCSPLIFALM